MEEEVKFIFKTLIKVPIIIFVAYLIFNLFGFTLSYFKMLGFSYAVMQTAIENNYIPNDEGDILENYADSLNTYMLRDVQVLCSTDVDISSDDPPTGLHAGHNVKVQYGKAIKVGVTANYVWVWPFSSNRDNFGNDKRVVDYLEYNENTNNNINIIYTVPGLKYYPDLNR